MIQVLKNAENPVDFTGWDEHDASWTIVGGNFVGGFANNPDYLGQDVGANLGDSYTLEYEVLANDYIGGDFKIEATSAFGSSNLDTGVGVHTVQLTVTNASPTHDFRISTATPGFSGSVTFGYFRLYKNGEMVLNSEGVESMWGW